MRLARRNDWPNRLMDAVAAAKAKPFAWGESDCCLFACDCILAMTGVDPAAWFRGRYTTRKGAMRCLKTFSGGGIAATVERIAADCRAPEILPTQAQRGDVLLVDAPECPPERLAMGVCVGTHIAAMGPHGVTLVPLARGLRAWRV